MKIKSITPTPKDLWAFFEDEEKIKKVRVVALALVSLKHEDDIFPVVVSQKGYFFIPERQDGYRGILHADDFYIPSIDGSPPFVDWSTVKDRLEIEGHKNKAGDTS